MPSKQASESEARTRNFKPRAEHDMCLLFGRVARLTRDRRGESELKTRTLAVSSLRTKLVLLCLLLVLVPGVIFGIIAISSGRRSLTEAVGRQLGEEARNAADRLSAQLEERRVGLVTIARQDLMREVRIGDLDKRVASLLSSAQQGDPSCLGLIATDTSGHGIAASDPGLLERSVRPRDVRLRRNRGPVLLAAS